MLLSKAISFAASEQQRSELISFIYGNASLRQAITSYVLKNSGNSQDALIVFDDTIVQFIKTAFSTSKEGMTGELEPYLMGIAKHIWYAELRKKQKHAFVEIQDHMQENTEFAADEIFLTKERYAVLHTILEQLRSNCRAVLMYWANGFTMAEIAQKLNYLSEGMARKKKSQCLAELNDFLYQNPHLKKQLQP